MPKSLSKGAWAAQEGLIGSNGLVPKKASNSASWALIVPIGMGNVLQRGLPWVWGCHGEQQGIWGNLEVQDSYHQAIAVVINHFEAPELELARSWLGYKYSYGWL